MTSDERNVINWAKAVARALQKWQRNPTVENQDKLLNQTDRLAMQVYNLEQAEKREKRREKSVTKDNVIPFTTCRYRKPRKP